MKNSLLISVCFLIGCTAAHQAPNESITQFDYRVETENLMADSIRTQLVKANPEFLKNMENPRAAVYSLKIGESMSELTYKPSVSNEQEPSHVEYENTPLTSLVSYKFKDSTAVYLQSRDSFIQLENMKANWRNGNKDSVILGIPVTLMLGTADEVQIKAWVSKDFDSDLSIYNAYCPQGFVLGYEQEISGVPPFTRQKMMVYPYKIKKTSAKSFERPLIEKTITMEEAMEEMRRRDPQR